MSGTQSHQGARNSVKTAGGSGQFPAEAGSIRDLYDKVDVSGLEHGWDAYIRRGTKEYYVCKSIRKEQLDNNQIKIMKILKGKENIGIMDVYDDGNSVKILMEPCVGDVLFARIKRKEKHFWSEAAKLTEIIVKVIKTCHSAEVTVGNLKENLVFADKSDDSSLKALFFKNADTPAKENQKKEDVRLAGEILYLLVTGKEEMSADDVKKIKNKSLNSSKWLEAPEEAKDLIRKMLGESLTAEAVLDHEWIRTKGAGADVTRLAKAVSKMKQVKIGEK